MLMSNNTFNENETANLEEETVYQSKEQVLYQPPIASNMDYNYPPNGGLPNGAPIDGNQFYNAALQRFTAGSGISARTNETT